MLNLTLSPAIAQAYPGACCGFLALELTGGPGDAARLVQPVADLLDHLRQRYPEPASIKADPVIQAYTAYYKHFKKTYHVAQQIESVVFKGRGIPRVTPLVQAMFMAELESGLLTAGHDLATLQASGGSVETGVAQGDESYTLLRGDPQTLKPGDLFMRDGAGVISSIIYGPDQRTQITPASAAALYTVYAPTGVTPHQVEQHLAHLSGYAQIAAPGARLVQLTVLIV